MAGVDRASETQAGPAAVGPTYRAGAVGGEEFYRTNIATRSAAYTCRATQISQAAYDATTNRTYIAYSAGLAGPPTVDGKQFTAQNPTIMAYDHNSHTWEGPVEIFDVRGNLDGPNDCHVYPQVVVGRGGVLHVFYTFHANNKNILHFKSVRPHDISAWAPIRELGGTSTNSYAAAFMSKDGHLYVFYRATLVNETIGNNNFYYEPEMYVRSFDGGNSWESPRLLIDPGRPVGATLGWNTIYLGDWVHDRARNRLYFEFSATDGHQRVWGSRYVAYFDMTAGVVCTVKGTSLGPVLNRAVYESNPDLLLYRASLNLELMNANGLGLSQSIVIEDEINGYPTVYFVIPENPAVPFTDPAWYQTAVNRLKRARWDGAKWLITYVGPENAGDDPFAQRDGRNRAVTGIFDAGYRPGKGTFLYVKTRWGGHDFWLDAAGNRSPDYAWEASPERDYQNPMRVFNGRWRWFTSVRLFADHPNWEVRGVSNFTLVPGGHPAIRAVMHVPKYNVTMPTTGLNFQNQQFAIGADFVVGEQPLSQ